MEPYDETTIWLTVVFKGLPMKKFKKLINLPSQVIQALNKLSHEPNTIVIVTTPHPQPTLDRLFANTGVRLAAEKGCIYR